jgi:hypothetical protein
LNEGGRILFLFISKVVVSRHAIAMKMNGISLALNRAWVCPLATWRCHNNHRQLWLILKAICWWNKIQKNQTSEEALHHPSPLARKLKRTEPTIKHYTTPSHLSEKTKRIEPTTKHYITPLHWPENSK